MNKEEYANLYKKLNRLRKYTKDKYHLCISTDLEIIKWTLHRSYVDQDIYFSNDNKAIMTNETNTVEELEKYLKRHYEPSFSEVVNKASLCIMTVLWILYIAILIIFKKSTYFSGFLLGGLIINLVYLIISTILTKKHYDIVFLELKEESDKLEKRINDNLRENDNYVTITGEQFLKNCQRLNDAYPTVKKGIGSDN